LKYVGAGLASARYETDNRKGYPYKKARQYLKEYIIYSKITLYNLIEDELYI